MLYRRFWMTIVCLSLLGSALRQLRADPTPTPTAGPAANADWLFWERTQADRHGAIVEPDTGRPDGQPDSAELAITPDQDGPKAIRRVQELKMGAIRNGVTRNFAEHDAVLNAWIDVGIPVHPVISPRWECPRGTYNIAKDQMSEWYTNWESWCHDIFTHYRGRIFYYILDNEPDLIGGAAAIYTPAQAVQFTRIAYLEAKTVDPRIQIESPPTSSPETDYLQHMLQLGVGNYCDTVGIHIYGSQINENRFITPWKWMQQSAVYKPISASEAGVAVIWGRGPNGKRDPQIWRRNWQQLYYSQLKRYGLASTILFSLYGTYDGDFSYVSPKDDTPVEPIFNELEYGNRRRVFANGGFEQPNAFQREWVILYDADADAAPDGATFVRGDAAGAHTGSGYLRLNTADKIAPSVVQRVAANLKPGFSYTLSGWTLAQGGATATLSALGFDLTAGQRNVTASSTAAGKWQKLTVRFVPTSSWAVVRLSGIGGSLVKWDDVTLSGPAMPSKPVMPQGVTVFPTDRLVTLHWTPVLNASAVNIYRADKRQGPYLLVHAGVVGDPFTDWGVVNGRHYYYRLAALNGAGRGPLSAPIAATPTPAPFTPSRSDRLSLYSVSLLWTELRPT